MSTCARTAAAIALLASVVSLGGVQAIAAATDKRVTTTVAWFTGTDCGLCRAPGWHVNKSKVD